ncbi:ATP-dependent RNA helicase dbp7 [Chytriomyces hyalinus]|nr:ATP-dependent RNA helicase dbp7 [Chytriomyces hyalinus]
MDDDGLQMNFAMPTAPAQGSVSASVFGVGKGSWKKKRIVNKIAKSKAEKVSAPRDNRPIDQLSLAPTTTTTEKLAFKKPFQSGAVKVSRPTNKSSAANGGKPGAPFNKGGATGNNTAAKKNTSFVSSLFSGNPSLETLPVQAEDSDALAPKQTSNAVPEATDTNSFEGLGLNPLLISHLSSKMGVTVPTQIQRATLAALIPRNAATLKSLSFSKDALVQAQTGSGKTLAYLLPIVHSLIMAQTQCSEAERLNRSLGTVAIILAPTRELAKQICAVLETLLKYSSASATDGRPTESNIDASIQVENAEKEDAASDNDDDDDDDEDTETKSKPTASKPSRHWIVPGLVVGGDKKKSEKARLRKGCTILVSTPGRLIDHLKTTRAFEIGNLRWLVLDEADRFLELGFEETLRELLAIIDDKRKTCTSIQKRLKAPCWPVHKQILLTSATIKGSVQRLAETSLKDPLFIKAAEDEEKSAAAAEDTFDLAKKPSKGRDFIIEKKKDDVEDSDEDFWDNQEKEKNDDEDIADLLSSYKDTASAEEVNATAATAMDEDDEELFTVPEQLKQTYVIVPAKLRLVTLVAILRQIANRGAAYGGFKAILFADTCDSVDFLFHMLANGHKGPSRDEAEAAAINPKPAIKDKKDSKGHGKGKKGASKDSTKSGDEKDAEVESAQPEPAPLAPLSAEALTSSGLESPLFPSTTIFKLHGNLSQKAREQAYTGFKEHTHSLLICTDVAARGLDLPDISFVIQFDMPSDVKDYVHRIGRTARLGRAGSAVSLLLPSEAKYVDLLKRKGVVVAPEDGMAVLKHLVGAPVEGAEATAKPEGKGTDKDSKGKRVKKRSLEDWATDVQMMFERFIMADEKNLELARSAFRSHVRAYATHVSTERQLFNLKHLHLGHVAKSFGLRDAPGMAMGAPSAPSKRNGVKKPNSNDKKSSAPNLKRKAYQLQSSSSAASEFGDGGVQKLVGGTRKKFKNIY